MPLRVHIKACIGTGVLQIFYWCFGFLPPKETENYRLDRFKFQPVPNLTTWISLKGIIDSRLCILLKLADIPQ